MLVLFRSIHYVTAAKHTLSERGFWLGLVPIPREISSECGMGLLVDGSKLADVLDVLKAERMQVVGLYERRGGSYVPLASSGRDEAR